jgi:hypothetical protein
LAAVKEQQRYALGEGDVALFVLMVAALVVAQTWLDWRDAKKDWVVPEWAKGMALAGAVAVSLTAATSFASSWLQDPASASNSTFNSAMFWPELGFLLCAMGVIIVAVRKKRLRLMLLLTGILTAAFWIGMTLS